MVDSEIRNSSARSCWAMRALVPRRAEECTAHRASRNEFHDFKMERTCTHDGIFSACSCS